MASVSSLGKSKTDQFYRRLVISKFFSKGWGNINTLKRLFEFRLQFKEPEKCKDFVPSNYPVHLDKIWTKESYQVAEGHFLSPVAKLVPGLLPKESEDARFQVIIPSKWHQKDKKPICIHLAGTGDHFFWRRRNFMAKPLIKEHGIASIILENPFYGSRKPKDQQRSSLKHVVDLFIMGAGLILESSVLLHWCERQGYGPLGITGISMGGHMASLAATVWPKPLAVIPCLSWSTASSVFTRGVLKHSLPWKFLRQQLEDESYREALIKVAGLSEDVEEKNLFTKSMRSSALGLQSSPDVLSHSRNNTQHFNVYKNGTRELDMHLSQTVYLEKKHIFNTVKDTVLDYMPLKRSVVEESDIISQETIEFMNIVMDKATHLKNFSCPYEPSLAKFVAAKHDAYVPYDCVDDEPKSLWPGSEVEFVDAGHIGASLYHLDIFRRAIKEKLDQVV